MNVYDFDKTIFNADSTVKFFLYCLKKQPVCALGLPAAALGIAGYKLKIIEKTRGKEAALSFLRHVKNAGELVESFWDENMKNIYPWYLAQKREDDVVISASPEFLLKVPCERLGAGRLIASKVDICTGKFSSPNCYGAEKPSRFCAEFAADSVDFFYSDSRSDEPMARLAKKSFLIVDGKITDWM